MAKKCGEGSVTPHRKNLPVCDSRGTGCRQGLAAGRTAVSRGTALPRGRGNCPAAAARTAAPLMGEFLPRRRRGSAARLLRHTRLFTKHRAAKSSPASQPQWHHGEEYCDWLAPVSIKANQAGFGWPRTGGRRRTCPELSSAGAEPHSVLWAVLCPRAASCRCPPSRGRMHEMLARAGFLCAAELLNVRSETQSPAAGTPAWPFLCRVTLQVFGRCATAATQSPPYAADQTHSAW